MQKKEHSQQITQGIIYAIIGAILFSSKSIIIKFLYQYHIEPATTLGFRLLMALPFFIVIAWYQSKQVKTGVLKKLTLSDKFKIVFLGFMGYFLSSYLDIASLRYISVSLERLILLLSPTFVLFFSIFFLKYKVNTTQIFSLLLSYFGVLLVLFEDFSVDGSHVLLGSSLVLTSAITYAIYILGAGELIRSVGSTRFVAYAMITSTGFSLIQLIYHEGFQWLNQLAPVYGWSFIHAVANTVIPTFLLMWSVERIGAAVSTQLGLIGPASLLFLAWLFLDEPITLIDIIGTAIVLLGAYILGRNQHAKQK